LEPPCRWAWWLFHDPYSRGRGSGFHWSAEGSHFSFRFTPRYAIRPKAAPPTLYDYYNPDLKSVLAPQAFTVTDRSPR
jgi:hypothetical protein